MRKNLNIKTPQTCVFSKTPLNFKNTPINRHAKHQSKSRIVLHWELRMGPLLVARLFSFPPTNPSWVLGETTHCCSMGRSKPPEGDQNATTYPDLYSSQLLFMALNSFKLFTMVVSAQTRLTILSVSVYLILRGQTVCHTAASR